MGRNTDDKLFAFAGLLIFAGAILGAAVWLPLIGISLLGVIVAFWVAA